MGLVEDVSAEAWSRAFDVNVRGYALMAKHIVPHMKQQRSGSIIQFGSISGVIAQPGFVPYNTTKGAVIQMTRNLALDLGAFNIRCNSVSPGCIGKRFVVRIDREDVLQLYSRDGANPSVGGFEKDDDGAVRRRSRHQTVLETHRYTARNRESGGFSRFGLVSVRHRCQSTCRRWLHRDLIETPL